jgi:hypothetical protein
MQLKTLSMDLVDVGADKCNWWKMRKGTEMAAHMARLRSMREKVCADRDTEGEGIS